MDKRDRSHHPDSHSHHSSSGTSNSNNSSNSSNNSNNSNSLKGIGYAMEAVAPAWDHPSLLLRKGAEPQPGSSGSLLLDGTALLVRFYFYQSSSSSSASSASMDKSATSSSSSQSLDATCGGQYSDLRYALRAHFNRLLRCGYNVTVFLDGMPPVSSHSGGSGSNSGSGNSGGGAGGKEKEPRVVAAELTVAQVQTAVKRSRFDHKLLPFLARATLLQTLAQLHIPVRVCSGGGSGPSSSNNSYYNDDVERTLVAAAHAQPSAVVVSHHYHLYTADLPGGFTTGLRIETRPGLSFHRFHVDQFCETMKMRKELLPVYAALLSDEEASAATLRGLKGEHRPELQAALQSLQTLINSNAASAAAAAAAAAAANNATTTTTTTTTTPVTTKELMTDDRNFRFLAAAVFVSKFADEASAIQGIRDAIAQHNQAVDAAAPEAAAASTTATATATTAASATGAGTAATTPAATATATATGAAAASATTTTTPAATAGESSKPLKKYEFHEDKFTATMHRFKFPAPEDTPKPLVETMAIPDWVLEAYHSGDLAVGTMELICTGQNWLPVAFEDVDKQSFHAISKEIRRATYGIIWKNHARPTLKEWNRVGTSYTASDVTCADQAYLPALEDVHNMTEENRRKAFLRVLKTKATEAFNDLAEEYKLTVAAIRYLIQSSSPKLATWELAAILMTLSRNGRLARKPPVWVNPRAVHLLAQWQSVILYTNSLNEILRTPFHDIRIDSVYDGTIAHSIFNDVQKSKSIYPTISKIKTNEKFFWKMYTACTADLTDYLTGGPLERQQRERRVVLKQEAPHEVQTKNAFGFLDGDVDDVEWSERPRNNRSKAKAKEEEEEDEEEEEEDDEGKADDDAAAENEDGDDDDWSAQKAGASWADYDESPKPNEKGKQLTTEEGDGVQEGEQPAKEAAKDGNDAANDEEEDGESEEGEEGEDGKDGGEEGKKKEAAGAPRQGGSKPKQGSGAKSGNKSKQQKKKKPQSAAEAEVSKIMAQFRSMDHQKAEQMKAKQQKKREKKAKAKESQSN